MDSKDEFESKPPKSVTIGELFATTSDHKEIINKKHGSKIEFIKKLLKSHLLEPKHKEKLLALASEEMKNLESDHQSVKKDVDVIKKKLREISDAIGGNFDGRKLTQSNSKIGEKNKNDINIKTHKPQEFADFMQLFNDRDGFKYLTHGFDKPEEFNIKDFLNKAESIFKKYSNQFKIPTNIYSIINHFAFEKHLGEKNKKGKLIHWRDKDNKAITQGWSSNEIIKWSTTNKISPYKKTSFLQIINAFRDVIRIEATSSVKSHLLCNMITGEIQSQNVDEVTSIKVRIEKSLKEFDCYCHVPSLKESLHVIFDEIFSATKKSNYVNNDINEQQLIKISHDTTYQEDYKLNHLVIEHTNSYPGKNLNSILDDWFKSKTKGSIGTIRENLFRMADWTIITKVMDNGKERFLKFNLMAESENDFFEDIAKNKVSGFKHIITFYYKP